MKSLNTLKHNFYEGLKAFFQELNVPVDYLTEESARPQDILKENYKSQNETFSLMEDVYFLGIVNDAIFNGNKTFNTTEDVKKKISRDYEGLVIFGVTLRSRPNGLLPTRNQLAEITRALNREFKYTPAVVVFKYDDYLAFANSERVPYKQTWREGEKVGKVSLLKDIELDNPHRGHLAILEKLKIITTGRNAIKNFIELYFYWQSVFSISVLNKVFYQEIIGWFNNAIQDIRIPSQNSGSEKHKDFTVRLIARLIFIWFLKELKVVKDELLIPELNNGEVNDLIVPKRKGTSYYKFVLQNLFFNALNSEQTERDQILFDVYASDFEKINEIKNLIFFSPYLNGGLFDIHSNDWCEKGKVNNAFVVPDHLFLDRENGINSILNSYKFTIAENTPLEEEIAVDPEMLGRIFENLLAEQTDDTKEAARKNAGAFYTPRPVVSYMCRNTLLKHLNVEITPENGKEIIHKLLNTTVLDPACGSGAFPMGMLEEMMQVLEDVDPDGNIWISEILKSKDRDFLEHISDFIADRQIRYVKKLGLLRKCLFGIDLLDYAIEITKLRCWLSLIVEQKVDFNKQNYNLKPLPNLEFKFYQKNSLFRYYKDQNLNEFISLVDEENLLAELVNLENEYFITKSDRYGTKEEIKQKIVDLLERVVDKNLDKVDKQYKSAFRGLQELKSYQAKPADIKRAENKVKKLVNEQAELAEFRNTIKEYFIERVVFPGIFNSQNPNPGFDIVIGNPPYVNTKLISSMGLTKKFDEEYGYCDDLYNHFTIRGLELIKKGGILSYITSDTFLTLQTKKNMRMQFLGISQNNNTNEGLFAQQLPECRVTEIINTPKAFAALVDTAIFCVLKKEALYDSALCYVDLRKPNADTFEITEQEWTQIKSSKENLASWERVLDHTFKALGHHSPNWKVSHSCDGDQVFKDQNSSLLKFKISFAPYRKAINYAIFSPTPYNCQILEKIIKPARHIFGEWWNKIETSKKIDNNRNIIRNYSKKLTSGEITLIGLLTDGGQGLATGNNGRYVGYKSNTHFAKRCRETRIDKLYQTIQKYPEMKEKWPVLKAVRTKDDVAEILNDLNEEKIWQLFDEIKADYGLRVFGKGYMYRIVPDEIVFDVANITEKQKAEGIAGKRCFVPYDKGDKQGNRWYLETSYLIDWSEEAVSILRVDERARWQGYNFFFRNGFCWSDVLNPNSVYIKCRLKGSTVNDVKSMSLYDEINIGSEYFVCLINSYLSFKMLREFFNSTVAIQINDIRKLPIKIPSAEQLSQFKEKFNQCLAIKKQYFSGELENKKANELLKPIEAEIDQMVNELYGIDVSEEIEADEVEEEFLDEIALEDDLNKSAV